MAFCEQCGNKLKEGIKFCGKCGAPVPADQPEDAQMEDTQTAAPGNEKPPAILAFEEGLACKAEEKFDEAIAHFTEAVRLCPDEQQIFKSNAFFERGFAYSMKDDNDRAIADFTQALRINPENTEALYFRGMSYHDKDQYDLAITDYTQAIRRDPNDAAVYRSRGMAYSFNGNPDAAIADFTKALQLTPNDAVLYGCRGMEYAGKGDLANARADLEQGLQIDPNEEMLGRLAAALEEAGAQGASASGACAQCGTPLEEGEMFCPNCGAKVGAVAQVQSAPVQAQSPIPQPQPAQASAQTQVQAMDLEFLKQGLFSMKKPVKDGGILYLCNDRVGFIGNNNIYVPFGEILSIEKSDIWEHIKITMINNTVVEFTPAEESISKAFINGLLWNHELLDSWFNIISYELNRWRQQHS